MPKNKIKNSSATRVTVSSYTALCTSYMSSLTRANAITLPATLSKSRTQNFRKDDPLQEQCRTDNLQYPKLHYCYWRLEPRHMQLVDYHFCNKEIRQLHMLQPFPLFGLVQNSAETIDVMKMKYVDIEFICIFEYETYVC